MTTEATETTRYQTVDCSNCGDPVAKRRPSLSGMHFCPKPGCQTAKQGFHYRRRRDSQGQAAQAEAEIQEQSDRAAVLLFVRNVLQHEWVTCDTCGRASVLPTYPHPVPDWSSACPSEQGNKFPRGLGQQLAELLYPRD